MTRSDGTFRLLAFVVFLAAAISLQWLAGAYSSEFSSHPDEPAHFVNGLIVRDYIASGLPWPPMEFARNYYSHYPKVTIGHWPPFFYMLQAVFQLVFPPGRMPVMLLMACLSALTAMTVTEVVRSEAGMLTGICAGFYLLSFPDWQRETSSVMTEVLLSLLILWSLLALSRYLEQPGLGRAAVFGLPALLALMTKGTGIALAPIPPLAIVLTRRFSVLRKPSFWAPAVIVLGIALPWYLAAPGALHEKVALYGGLAFHPFAFLPTILYPITQMKIIPVAFLAAGVLDLVVKPLFRGKLNVLWAVLFSLFPSILIFRLAIGAWGLRHMIYMLPVAVIFVAVSLQRSLPQFPLLSRFPQSSLAALALAVFSAVQVWPPPRKASSGLREVARAIVAIPGIDGAGVLVASDSSGEGMLVSEIALADRRPGIFVIRGSKIVAPTTFMGASMGQTLISSSDLQKKLESLPVSLVVIDLMPQDNPLDRRVLLRTMNAYPSRWEKVREFPRYSPYWDTPGRVLLYRLAGRSPTPLTHIPDQLFDMEGELGP